VCVARTALFIVIVDLVVLIVVIDTGSLSRRRL
jgi:hypothetical protein